MNISLLLKEQHYDLIKILLIFLYFKLSMILEFWPNNWNSAFTSYCLSLLEFFFLLFYCFKTKNVEDVVVCLFWIFLVLIIGHYHQSSTDFFFILSVFFMTFFYVFYLFCMSFFLFLLFAWPLRKKNSSSERQYEVKAEFQLFGQNSKIILNLSIFF
jgi:hypothetical protein